MWICPWNNQLSSRHADISEEYKLNKKISVTFQQIWGEQKDFQAVRRPYVVWEINPE